MKIENKNILLIIHSGALGGAERQGLGLAKYLVECKNCKVDLLLTFSDDQTEEFKDSVSKSKVNQVIFVTKPYLLFKKEFSFKNLKRLRWSIQYLKQLKKTLIKNDYDVIIPYLNFPSKVAYYLYKLLPTVKITFWHQLGLDTTSNDWFEYLAAKHTPLIIGNATNCFEMFESTYKRKSEDLFMLPQYLTLNFKKLDKTTLRNTYKIPEEAFVFGMVAHYREDKKQDLLIEAFRAFNQDNIHVVFLGNKNNTEGTLKKYNRLNSLVEELGLQDKISILSGIRVHEVLGMIDVGVLLSQIEGMPNTVMEYMLYGLPIISSSHPGCQYLLQESNLLVNNSVDEVCKKMKLIASNTKLYNAESKKNKKRIKHFTIPKYVEQLEQKLSNYTNLN